MTIREFPKGYKGRGTNPPSTSLPKPLASRSPPLNPARRKSGSARLPFGGGRLAGHGRAQGAPSTRQRRAWDKLMAAGSRTH